MTITRSLSKAIRTLPSRKTWGLVLLPMDGRYCVFLPLRMWKNWPKPSRKPKEKRTVLPSLLFPPILVLAVRARIWPVRTANRWALRMWLPLKKPPVGIRKSPSMCLMKCGLISKKRFPRQNEKRLNGKPFLMNTPKNILILQQNWWTA